MENIQSFWNMGGYAAYIWPAYAFALGTIALMGAQSWRRLQKSRSGKA